MPMLQYYKIKRDLFCPTLMALWPRYKYCCGKWSGEECYFRINGWYQWRINRQFEGMRPICRVHSWRESKIGKRPAEYGVCSTLRLMFSNCEVRESSMYQLRNKYLDELSKRKRACDGVDVTELWDKEREVVNAGWGTCKQMQSYVLDLQQWCSYHFFSYNCCGLRYC